MPTFGEVRNSVPEERKAFDQVEESLQAWIPRYRRARAAARYEERRFKDTGLVTARRQGAHVLAANAIRVLDLGAGLIVLMNASRAHAAYASARALFESCASVAYLDAEIRPRIAKGRDAQVRKAFVRLHLGVDPGVGFQNSSGAAPIPVSALIKALCRQADASSPSSDGEGFGMTLRHTYSWLSDHSHPNYAAQHLSSQLSDDLMMDWHFDHEWTASTIHDLLGSTFLALHFGGEAFDCFLKGLADHPLTLDDKRHRTIPGGTPGGRCGL